MPLCSVACGRSSSYSRWLSSALRCAFIMLFFCKLYVGGDDVGRKDVTHGFQGRSITHPPTHRTSQAQTPTHTRPHKDRPTEPNALPFNPPPRLSTNQPTTKQQHNPIHRPCGPAGPPPTPTNQPPNSSTSPQAQILCSCLHPFKPTNQPTTKQQHKPAPPVYLNHHKPTLWSWSATAVRDSDS